MNTHTIEIARAYYTAMGEKNTAALAQYLHPEVQFSTPFGKSAGRETVLGAVQGFVSMFNRLTIRTVFGSENQALVVYDVEFPAPIGQCPSTALLTVNDNLITKIELFYDARPFERD